MMTTLSTGALRCPPRYNTMINCPNLGPTLHETKINLKKKKMTTGKIRNSATILALPHPRNNAKYQLHLKFLVPPHLLRHNQTYKKGALAKILYLLAHKPRLCVRHHQSRTRLRDPEAARLKIRYQHVRAPLHEC